MREDLWSDERIAELRRLWDEGLSAKAIGRAMNLSKNSVVGKAHRLNLASRPSPIIRNAEPREPKVRRARKGSVTLPPLSVEPEPEPAQAVVTVANDDVAVPLPDAPRARPPAACCFITSDRKPWTFCQAVSARGSVYCAEHHALAYQRPVKMSAEDRAQRDVAARRLKSGFMLRVG